MYGSAIGNPSVFALGLTLAWLAGVRVYLTVFGIGLAGALGWMILPPDLRVTSSPWVISTCAVLALIEFMADKIPGVDTGWDLLHTLLRVPVGAFLAAAAISPDGKLGSGALLAGGALTLTSHAIKTGTRALINASPEPLSNWSASLGEDAVSMTALVLLLAHPWLALGLSVGGLLLAALLVSWVFRKVLRRVLHRRPEAMA
jgi:hypothetical protein